ncbi:MAG: penicillin acylase family protein [Vicinamibacterales bacterium]
MWRWLLRGVYALLTLLLLLGGAGYLYLRQSLPVTSGRIDITGISAPVVITRDQHAVPHIVGATKADALFGLGYVHAQDRLWQMEFQRRIGHGRLSEVFGPATIRQDRFLRTVGFSRAATSAWAHLPATAQQQVREYLAGINAFINAHHGRALPPEFTLLRFEPEPFTPEDVMVWIKMMAWDLSANYSLEMMRHDLAAAVGAARMTELLPPYPVDGLSIVTSFLPLAPGGAVAPQRIDSTTGRPLFGALTASLTGGRPEVSDFILGGGRLEALGSNNWVVDGTMTASGKPLLANDPHLGTKIPSLWYLAHLSAGDFDLVGATLPGVPAVALGRNRYIAWGATNVAADVEDLYQERLDATGTSAEFRGAMEPMRILHESIAVKGAAAVALEVRITRHGPLVSDAINANNAASTATVKPAPVEPLALRWTALDEEDQTLAAFLQLNEARNWAEFTSAFRFYNSPSQNFVYADVDGHIGYFAPGHIPIRSSGDGSVPVPGWTGEAEWTGWIPFNELPQTLDPREHLVVTANNRPMPTSYPRLIALEYPNPYRAQRITDLLAGRMGLTAEDFRHIQADTHSLHAAALLPRLLPFVQSDRATTRQAVELLKTWTFDAGAGSAAEAIFQAWFLRLAPAIAGDELGTAIDSYRGRFSFITRFVTNITNQRTNSWCDDTRTAPTETCEQSITAALEAGLTDLTTRLGSDMARWRWDGVHRAVFPHQGLDSVAPLRWLLSRAVPNGGDWSTVNVGPVAADSLYDQVSVPGYRQILDLSAANDSHFLDDVGQSGHALSPYYDDALKDWQTVTLRKLRMTAADINDNAVGTLTLLPAGR